MDLILMTLLIVFSMVIQIIVIRLLTRTLNDNIYNRF